MEIEWNVKELHVYGDSQLIINQINDDYQTKDDKIMSYKQLVEEFKEHFREISFTQIPRNENKATDAMATIAHLLQNQENQHCYEFIVEDINPYHSIPTYLPNLPYIRNQSILIWSNLFVLKREYPSS